MAPLHELVEVCERHGAALIVDETHSFGAQGPGGAGLVVAAGLAERVHFRTIGLSKAVASRGGLIVCSRRNAEYFRYESLPAIFSTSVMQHEVAGYDAVLDILENEEWRRDQPARQSRLPQGGARSARLQRRGLEDADHRAGGRRHPPDDDAARCARIPRRVRRDLLPARDAGEALPHPLHGQLRLEPRASSIASSRSAPTSARKWAWPSGARRGARRVAVTTQAADASATPQRARARASKPLDRPAQRRAALS